jgi:PAS domain S-box-containing protein
VALSLRSKILLAFAAALAILGAVGLVSYRNAVETSDSAAWVAHTLEVRHDIDELVSEMKDAETGYRGYILTNRPSFLVPFDSAARRGPALVRALRDLIQNPAQQRRLDTLALLVNAKLAFGDSVVAVLRRRSQSAATDLVLTERGKVLMDQIRGVGRDMGVAELRLLAERTAILDRTASRTRHAIIIGSAVAILLLLLAGISVTRELAARQRAEQELDRFFSLSLDLLCIATFDGRFIRLNPAWEKTLGYTLADLKAAPFLDFVHPEDRERTVTEMGRLVAGSNAVGFENRYRCKDGSYRWLLWMATPVPDRGLVYATARDITERKEAEVALRQANAELEAFSYSVSHDLRAPLRAIDGFARTLTLDAAPTLGPENLRLLEVIRSSAKQMGQLIDDLLAFSRLSRKSLDAADVDLAALARAVVEEVRKAGGRPGVEVVVAPLPPTRGDPAMLHQALFNLVDNAMKFTRHQPAARIEIGTRAENGESIYYVRDNGAGFDMRYAAKLFGVFQRLHRTDEFEGTGVGLALVQRIVHRHGGRVWAEGAVDRGATFYFTLPGVS